MLSGAGAGFCVRERRRGFTRVDTIIKEGERAREGTRDTARQRRGFGVQRGTLRDDARRFVYSPSESQIDPFSSPLSPTDFTSVLLPTVPPSRVHRIDQSAEGALVSVSSGAQICRCIFPLFLPPPPPSHSVT